MFAKSNKKLQKKSVFWNVIIFIIVFSFGWIAMWITMLIEPLPYWAIRVGWAYIQVNDKG